jgi:hypothetical protein
MGAGNRDSCRKIFKLLNILPLSSQYIYSLVMFVVNNKNLFVENSELYATKTRNSLNLHLPLSNLTVFQCLQYFAIKVYNSLPGNIKQLSGNKNQFKKVLLQFLHSHSFYDIGEFFKYRDKEIH